MKITAIDVMQVEVETPANRAACRQMPLRPGIGNELSEYALTHCRKVTIAR
ncbi:MAG: hypothetical protein IJ468_13205 [Lachnospiraceae bacterium]|nr:hypothetical protein [Lachnospiraceae bacterium]